MDQEPLRAVSLPQRLIHLAKSAGHIGDKDAMIEAANEIRKLRAALEATYVVIDQTARNSYGTERFEKTFDHEHPEGYEAWKQARAVLGRTD